jgi:hypothetical protein
VTWRNACIMMPMEQHGAHDVEGQTLGCHRNADGANCVPGKHDVGVNRDCPAGSLPKWRVAKRVDCAAVDYYAVKSIRLTFHGITEYGMVAIGRGLV